MHVLKMSFRGYNSEGFGREYATITIFMLYTFFNTDPPSAATSIPLSFWSLDPPCYNVLIMNLVSALLDVRVLYFHNFCIWELTNE